MLGSLESAVGQTSPGGATGETKAQTDCFLARSRDDRRWAEWLASSSPTVDAQDVTEGFSMSSAQKVLLRLCCGSGLGPLS